MKTPDYVMRSLVACTELNLPKEAQHSTMFDALACIQQLEAANNELLTKCERLERERDAAVADLRGHCWCCKHARQDDVLHGVYLCDKLTFRGFASGCKHWEWRGVKEE